MAEKVKSTSVHKHVLKTVRFTMWKGKMAPKFCLKFVEWRLLLTVMTHINPISLKRRT